MTLAKKTKDQLIAEVKKLQRKVVALSKVEPKTKSPKVKIATPSSEILKESKWESFFKNSANIILVVDKKGIILDINKLAKGTKKESVIGKSSFYFLDKQSAAVMKRAIDSVFKTKKPTTYKSTRKTEKGESVFYHSVATPLFENKKIVAVVLEATDITREEQHLQSKKDLSLVLDNIKELVYYVELLPNQERKIKYLGKQIWELFGITQKEYQADPKILTKLCHPDDLPNVVKTIQRVREKCRPEKITYRFMHRGKKEYVWLEEHITPQLDKQGKHIGNFGITRDVTDYVESEKKLRQSEERFRMLAENAQDVVYRFIMRPTPRYEYISPSILHMSGYTPEEFYADPNLGFKIVHPDDRHILGDSQKIINDKVTIDYIKAPKLTLRWICKDGRIVWTESVNTPIKDEKGKVIGIEGISHDITQQKESEERFKILSNATFEGIVFSDNGKIIDANDQFVKMYGFDSSSEFIGKNLVNDFVIEEQKSIAHKFVRLPKSDPMEVQTIRKDGSIITVEAQGQNIPYFGKNIRATVIYNITERKQSERNLRESERALSTLMNNLPGMAYRCKKEGVWKMEFVSKGCLELTGYKPFDLTGNKKISYWETILPEYKTKILEKIESSLESKTPYILSYKIKSANDEIKWVWEKGEGVYDDNGKLLFAEGFVIDATDRQKFEVELKRSRENYKSLVDYSPDGVIIHVDGRIKFANPSALNIIGVKTFEEIDNISALDFILPEYHQQILERIKKTKLGEEQGFSEMKIKNKNGEVKELETKPIAIKFNGMDAIQVVFHDVSTQKQLAKEQIRAQIAEETNELLEQEITKRKVIQLQLQESQKYTRLLIDSSIDMICASDKNGCIIEFNLAALKTFGYEPNEIFGKHVSMLYANPEDRVRITDEEIFVKGNFAGEVLNKKKNGELFMAFLSASVLKNEDGEVVGAMGVSRDISELKKSEEELKLQSAKLNAVFESSSHIIWTVDKNICLTSFNKNFFMFLKKHYNLEVYNGLCMIEGPTVSTNEYNNYWIKKYEAVMKGEAQHFETKLVNKADEIVWREIFLNPIFDDSGDVIEISGIGHDVTEKKFAEEKIRQSLQEKEVLLKEVHHRVKNNLQVISSILNLQSSYVKDAGTLNILKESQNRIKSMAFIHESLYQTKDFSSINFSEYVVNLSQNLLQSYSNSEQEIKLNLDIQNVFLNLDLAIPCGLIINEIVSNALKYAFVDKKSGGEISIKMSLEGENLLLRIGDNGVGLAADIDFRNTPSLGLQLVVTLTDQLNGTIELDTKHGTNYTIQFKQNQVKNRI